MEWRDDGAFGKASGTTRKGRGFGTYSTRIAGRVNRPIREEAGEGLDLPVVRFGFEIGATIVAQVESNKHFPFLLVSSTAPQAIVSN